MRSLEAGQRRMPVPFRRIRRGNSRAVEDESIRGSAYSASRGLGANAVAVAGESLRRAKGSADRTAGERNVQERKSRPHSGAKLDMKHSVNNAMTSMRENAELLASGAGTTLPRPVAGTDQDPEQYGGESTR